MKRQAATAVPLFDHSINWRVLKDSELAQAAREYLELCEKSVRNAHSDAAAAAKVIEGFNKIARPLVAIRRRGGPAARKWTVESALRLYAMARRCELHGLPLGQVLGQMGDAYAIPLESAESIATTYNRARSYLKKLGLLKRVELLLQLERLRARSVTPAAILEAAPNEECRRELIRLLDLGDDDLLPPEYPTIASKLDGPPAWSPSPHLLSWLIGA